MAVWTCWILSSVLHVSLTRFKFKKKGRTCSSLLWKVRIYPIGLFDRNLCLLVLDLDLYRKVDRPKKKQIRERKTRREKCVRCPSCRSKERTDQVKKKENTDLDFLSHRCLTFLPVVSSVTTRVRHVSASVLF